ncbi:MAG: hypothetical protein B7Z40_21655 [Bosea sp. 12-68-7]|nr:MAG: hypothetical protein B7Z40_21655 [Bosea sp. 12-68-7]
MKTRLSLSQKAGLLSLGLFAAIYLNEFASPRVRNIVKPTLENIASGEYRLARPLYFYIKKAHIDRLPAIKDYALAFMSEEAAGDNGYLKEHGLVPLPATERAKVREAITAGTVMQH